MGQGEPEAPAARSGKLAAKKQQTGCWPCRKEVVEVPLFDDVNCPYPIKPTELFKINEVCPAGCMGPHGIPVLLANTHTCLPAVTLPPCRTRTWRSCGRWAA